MLIPIVAVAAIILGVVVAWLAHRHWRRSRGIDGRTSGSGIEKGGDGSRLLSGGKYEVSETEDPDASLFHSHRDDKKSPLYLTDVGTPSKSTRHGSVYRNPTAASRKSGNSIRSLGSALLSGTRSARPPFSTPRYEHKHELAETQALSPTRGLSSYSASAASQYGPTPKPKPARPFSPDTLNLLSEDDDEEVDVVQSKSRHLLDRIRAKSGRRAAKLPRDGRCASLRSGPAYSALSTPAATELDIDGDGRGRRIESAATTPFLRDDDADAGADLTDWMPGVGFRIVEEDLEAEEPVPQAVEKKSQEGWMAWTKSWVEGVGGSGEGGKEDRYTPMPERKSLGRRSKSQRSQTSVRSVRAEIETSNDGATASHVTKQKASTPTAPLHVNVDNKTRAGKPAHQTRAGKSGPRRVDSSMLPSSPPLIRSPQLDSALLFSPKSLSMALGSAAVARNHPRTTGPAVDRRKSTKSTRTTTSSEHGTSTPSSLPYPSKFTKESSIPNQNEYKVSLKGPSDDTPNLARTPTTKSKTTRSRSASTSSRIPAPRPDMSRTTTQPSAYSDSNETSVSALVATHRRYAESNYTPGLGSEYGRTPALGVASPAQRYAKRKGALNRVEETFGRDWEGR